MLSYVESYQTQAFPDQLEGSGSRKQKMKCGKGVRDPEILEPSTLRIEERSKLGSWHGPAPRLCVVLWEWQAWWPFLSPVQTSYSVVRREGPAPSGGSQDGDVAAVCPGCGPSLLLQQPWPD